MGLTAWITEFRRLHEKARRGELPPDEQSRYERDREELAAALVAAQRLTLRPGETPRQAIRVARVLQVDLDLPGGRQRAMTADLSPRGFSALMGDPPKIGAAGECTLKLGGEPLTGEAVVVDVRKQPFNFRVAFSFKDLSAKDRERLETTVFDMVLEQISR